MRRFRQEEPKSKKGEEDLRTITVLDMCPKAFTEGAHVPLNTLITILILPLWPRGLGNLR